MTHAIVLIQAERSALSTLGDELADIEGVAEAYSVTGEWDFVAILRLREQDQLAQVVTGQALPADRRATHADDGRLRGLLQARPRGALLRRSVGRLARARPGSSARAGDCERPRERGRHRLVRVGADRRAGGGARAARAAARSPSSRSIAAASAAGSPGAMTRPVSPSRTRPPAAAPTAVVAITGVPWCMASLQTSPHGSRKRGVGTLGTTTSAALASATTSSSRGSAPSGADARHAVQRGPQRPVTGHDQGRRAADPRPGLRQHVDALGRVRRPGEQRERTVSEPVAGAEGRRPPRRSRSGRTARARRTAGR